MLPSFLFAVLLTLSVGATKTFNVGGADGVEFVRVDAYAPCLRARARGDAYCFVSAALLGRVSDPLYNALVEHSAKNITHFNRTNIHRGICLKTSCAEYLSSSVMETVEACVNASAHREYGLAAEVFRAACTEHRQGARARLDLSDYAFGAVVLTLLLLNMLGSWCDFRGIGQDTRGGRVLSCFSLRRSWRGLVAPPSRTPAQLQLHCLSAYRSFFKFWVVFGHTGVPFVITIRNIDYLEKLYNNVAAHIIYNGTLIVQAFFIMSAFLLAFNILVAEKQRPLTGWRTLLNAIFARWLRLTPLYAFVIFFIATWMRHIGEGPFWKVVVEGETSDCRRDWWLHLLYIHNYVDINSRCMLHSWFLAVDLQLTAVGLAIFVLLKSTKARQAAIGLVVVAGLLAPGLAVFVYDLDAVTILSPEMALKKFVESPWFNKLYKRAHTNLACYGLGLALAYVVFNLRENDFGAKKYKKYIVAYYLVPPAVLALLMSGAVFYSDGPRAPWLARALYAGASKLLFGLLICLHIFLTIVKIDRVWTRFIAWQGWAVLRRLTYGVFLAHLALLSLLAGNVANTLHASQYELWKGFALAASGSLLVAAALFLAVEAPCARLAHLILHARGHKRDD